MQDTGQYGTMAPQSSHTNDVQRKYVLYYSVPIKVKVRSIFIITKQNKGKSNTGT